MKTLTINVDTEGVAQAIWDGPALGWMLEEGGQKRRASHVEPVGLLRRLAFRLLRRLFGEEGRAAAWTRRWRGPWRADLGPSGGPVLGPFWWRQDAIQAELDWLRVNLGL